MIRFHLNGVEVAADADPAARLSEVLREDLGARGTKVGCDAGDCGACTVLLDGRSVCACLTAVGRVDGCAVETVEGAGDTLTRLRAAFLRHGAAQCGICTPGMLMAARELVQHKPDATREDVREWMSGNYCRCTGYHAIVDAVCDVLAQRHLETAA